MMHTKISKPKKSDIDSSILSFKGELNKKIWTGKDNTLNNLARSRILQIVKDFLSDFEYSIKPEEIIITGSIANFNWNKYSDIDLHILVNFNKLPEKFREGFQDYFQAKKDLWNNKHSVVISGHEVEIYVQDADEPHVSSGIYSVTSDKWINFPSESEEDVDYSVVIKKTEQYILKIANVVKQYNNKEYTKSFTSAENLADKLKTFRLSGLEKNGEYSAENLAYKMLRNAGHIETLVNVKRLSYDYKMSIEENLFKYEDMIKENQRKSDIKEICYRGDKIIMGHDIMDRVLNKLFGDKKND